jgi:hypothetical protein
MNAQQIDFYRRRWRRARETRRLLDAEADDFGSGEIPPTAGKISVRLLVLPGDPEEHRIDFDEAFLAWWTTESADPHTDGPTFFGTEITFTADAAFHYRSVSEKQWVRYLAVTHAGALEMGLGRDAAYELPRSVGGEVPVFRLLTVVGRTAAALDRYVEVIQRYGTEGPWEISLALIGTRGSLLGDFATGWAEAGHPNHDGRQCAQPNVLMHRELLTWPTRDEAIALAHRLGDQMENSWGGSWRRYVAREGQNKGEFDIVKYGWR